MATRTWTGNAQAIAQVNTVTPANVNTGNTFTVTINGKGLTFTATAGTVANVTAGLTTLVNNSTIAEWTEVTATDNTTDVKITSKVAGRPFTQTSSASGGTATLTTVVTTASKGPKHIDDANNWSSNTLPTTDDTAVIENFSGDILYGLDNLNVSLAELDINSTFTGKLGLAIYNATGYPEYRARYWKISPRAATTSVIVGRGDGAGSSMIRLDCTGATNPMTMEVWKTAASSETGFAACVIKPSANSTGSNIFRIMSGSADLAVEEGDAGNVHTLQIGYNTVQATDAAVRVGKGASWISGGSITQNGGTLLIIATATLNTTSLNINAGVFTFHGASMTVAGNNFILDGNSVAYMRTGGTISGVKLRGSSILSFTGDPRSRTVSACDVFSPNVSIYDPFKTVSWTAGIDLNGLRLEDFGTRLQLGSDIRLTIGTPA